tara:strand:+ start:247 stop:480 length:234 start_codon:yes stop_codon:yes gene_type:complete
MSKEKTAQERAGFATGILNIAIFQMGWSLFREESWLTYLGFFLMMFAAVMAWKYMKPGKDTKADIEIEIGKKLKEDE